MCRCHVPTDAIFHDLNDGSPCAWLQGKSNDLKRRQLEAIVAALPYLSVRFRTKQSMKGPPPACPSMTYHIKSITRLY